ncbi:hypothetical protein SAMN06297251_112107 [Fulvimarina manganoxydans]|uniref:Uncharacterized protein n=1 Tax=Fulvimarina manganoxydans TaxID=937218 RepID=A0A1W2D3Q2_9HYPH|nr:hypothetical protein [Fulvimarina manganoxydans]SMC92113.1 hypothetical protein SAMN06297251_112107 [Fulvimarina manganoxydans]
MNTLPFQNDDHHEAYEAAADMLLDEADRFAEGVAIAVVNSAEEGEVTQHAIDLGAAMMTGALRAKMELQGYPTECLAPCLNRARRAFADTIDLLTGDDSSRGVH